MNVSLRLLRAFVAVSREGNVGRAAAAMFVSQPSLSQDIRRLERELQVPLFDRGPRGLTLTSAGREFLRAAESALALVDRGVEQARVLAAGDRPVITIAYSPSLGNKLMPELLPALEREIAALAIDVLGVDTGEVGAGVAAGRFDLGLAHCPEADAALATEHILDERLCVALGTDHPLAARTSVHLAELAGSTLLIWPRETAPSYYDRILEVCDTAGLGIDRVREHRRSMTRSYLFNEDDAFSLLPVSASFLHLPQTRFVEVADPGSTVPLSCLRRAGDVRPELRRITDLVRQVGGELATAHPAS
jgi:DNA-binding transcriptional LysR family regulator